MLIYVYKQILKKSYGFLCLQVISLSLDIAKLSQTGEFESFLQKISKLSANQSISNLLKHCVRNLEAQAVAREKRNGSFWLLGWQACSGSTIDRDQDTCLPQIGGCTVKQLRLLLGLLWSSRREFLRTSRWAAMMFPGWGGLLHILQDSLLRMNGTNIRSRSER